MHVKEHKDAQYILEDYIHERYGWANSAYSVDVGIYRGDAFHSFDATYILKVYINTETYIDWVFDKEDAEYIEKCYMRNKLQNVDIINQINKVMNKLINPDKNPKVIAEKKMKRMRREKEIKLYNNIHLPLDF